MAHRHWPRVVLPILALAACDEDRSPTGPQPSSTLSAEPVEAAVVRRVVNSLADPGDGTCDARQCTLREAIEASGTTAIAFAPGLTGTITLASPADGGGALRINTGLTITGPSSRITIRRRSTDPAFRILRVDTSATVTLTNLTIRNGRTDRDGGGILNRGRLTLVDCTVAGNAAARSGGGIRNEGPLKLTRSTVSDNDGSGITNVDVRLEATGSLIARNTGTGIVNGGVLAITNTTVSDNGGRGISEGWSTATLDQVRITGNSGGGYSVYQATVRMSRSTVARNTALEGAGILVVRGGEIIIAKSTVADNIATEEGGGILDLDDPNGRSGALVTLVNSTVTGNSAATGGGIQIHDRGSAFIVVTNSTVTSNSARVEGGGIRGGGETDDGPHVTLTNTLVALNTAPTGPDLLGTFGARFSLIGDGTGGDVTNTDGNQVGNVSPNPGPIAPGLAPLSNNGGPTRTVALLAGSPAIDAGLAEKCPGKDQRGISRPQGSACDIGSFEREGP